MGEYSASILEMVPVDICGLVMVEVVFPRGMESPKMEVIYMRRSLLGSHKSIIIVRILLMKSGILPNLVSVSPGVLFHIRLQIFDYVGTSGSPGISTDVIKMRGVKPLLNSVLKFPSFPEVRHQPGIP